MSEHRIEIICKAPSGSLETITVTVEAKTSQAKLSAFAKQIRTVLEQTMEPGPPLSIEHYRDYPVTR